MIVEWIIWSVTALDLFVTVFSEYPDIHVLSGATALLPCSVPPPPSDDSVVLVLWYRLDLPNPVYSVDARYGAQPRHFSGALLGARARFDGAHLVISPVWWEDEGDYRCRIDYKRGRTLNRMVKLNVVVPVKQVLIRTRGNTTYSGTIGPFTEGETLRLICEAMEGRPSPYVFWKKGASVIEGRVTITDKGWVQNELVFSPLRREDLLSVLVCQAVNSNLSAAMYASVTIDLNLKPLSIQITPKPGALVAGDRLELNCQSEGSKPPAQITWTRGSENISHLAVLNVFGGISVSNLQVVLTADDNGKGISCRAQNPNLPESALVETILLNVEFPPQMSLVLGASGDHLREGSDVYFECNLHANPSVRQVQWRFQGHPLPEPRGRSLLLREVGRRHRGAYQCTAQNARGEGESEEVRLRIQHSPYCIPRQQRTYGIVHQGRSNITCLVEADPPEVVFDWTFEGRAIEGHLKATSLTTRSVLEYHPRRRADYGKVECRARNAVGEMKEPCVFSVIPAGPPPPLRNCRVSNQTNSSLHVACDPEDSSPKPLTYHLEVYDLKGEALIANLSSKLRPDFFANDLSPGSSFIVVVFATGGAGKEKGETVAMTTSTLVSSSQKRTNKESNIELNGMLLIALIVIGILAVFTVLAGCFVVRSKPGGPSIQATTMETEMTEKLSSNKPSFCDDNSYIYHTSELPKEFVSPKSVPDCLFDSLMDEPQKSFSGKLCKSSSFSDEGIEVILPDIDR